MGTGVGWNATYLRDLRPRLDSLAATASAFTPPVSDSWLRKNAHWVRSELVVEVSFSVQGMRADKAPQYVVHEEPRSVPSNPTGRRR